MKKLIVFIFLLTGITFQTFGQSDFYQQKIQKFTRMRTIGYAGIGVGTCLTAAGAIVLINEANKDYTHEEGEESDWNFMEGMDKVLIGCVCMGFGVTCLAGGITMSSIASRKIKFYEGKASGLSLNIRFVPGNQALQLVYHF
jgi:hypothetical protein